MMSDFSGIASLLGAVAGGLLSFFSPCIFPLIPVYLGYLSGNDALSTILSDEDSMTRQAAKRALQINVLFFVAGISTIFFILGFFSGSIGVWFLEYLPVILKVAGLGVILFGLLQLNIIKLSLLQREKRLTLQNMGKGYLGTYVLGMAFSFGWTPCIGPILASILLLASAQGNALYSGVLLIFYSLGFGIPFLFIAFFTSTFLKHYKNFYPYFEKVKIIGGILLIIMGSLLFMGNLNIFLRFWPW
jgi:cytochrome c-type biogenesis protein